MPVFQVDFFGTVGGQVTSNTLYYDVSNANPDFQLFADDFGQAFNTELLPYLSDQYQVLELYIREPVVGSLGLRVTPVQWPAPGQDAGDALPTYDAFAVLFSGALLVHPRSKQIRLAGVSESQQSNGVVDNAALSLLNTAVDNLFLQTFIPPDGTTWTPVLYSKRYGTVNPIASITVKTRVTTQNSRKRGRGI